MNGLVLMTLKTKGSNHGQTTNFNAVFTGLETMWTTFVLYIVIQKNSDPLVIIRFNMQLYYMTLTLRVRFIIKLNLGKFQ